MMPLLTTALAALVLPAAPPYAWYPGNGGHGLFRGDVQAGYLDAAGRYFPREGPGQWGAACEPPVPRPVAVQDFGVDRSRLSGRPHYLHNGREIDRRAALEALAPAVPDDGHKLRLTIIGSEEERKQVLHDLDADPGLRALKDAFVVQAYGPDDLMVRDYGFATGGHPTIYLQKPNGSVLHRQDAYTGPGDLADAVRRARPDYDPGKDPDLTRPRLPLDLSAVPTPARVLLGLAALLLIVKRGPQ